MNTICLAIERFPRVWQFLRFVAVGAINTGLTYGLYLLGLRMLPYTIAYTLSYLLGILFAFFVNTKLVFDTTLDLRKLIVYPLIYVSQYLVNMGLIFLLINHLHISQHIAPLLVILLTIPLVFVLNKWLLLGARWSINHKSSRLSIKRTIAR